MRYLWIPLFFCQVLLGRDYYFDSTSGEDSNSGTSAVEAWKSLDKLNSVIYKPGDRLFLKRGEAFIGQINPKGSGKEGNGITLSAYGEGKRPIVNVEGKEEATVLLKNLSYWTIEGIEVSNAGQERDSTRKGLRLISDNGACVGITLRDIVVKDVNGTFYRESHGSHGIQFSSNSYKKPSYFDGLIIEKCHLIRCDRNGISGGMHPWLDLTTLSKNVIIRDNIIEDVGGDAIIVVGCEGAIVERNRVYGARLRFDTTDNELTKKAGASIGIWPLSSKNTVVRYNEVWDYKGVYDGQGYDSDINCENLLFEYNFSSNNEGGFALICNNYEKEKAGEIVGNVGTTMRNNISYNDQLRGFVLDGSIKETKLIGNIIYNTVEKELPLIIVNPNGLEANKGTVIIQDNLFYTTAVAKIFQGRWSPKERYGIWGFSKPLSASKFQFRNNFYSNVEKHNEEGMKALQKDETLKTLIRKLSTNESKSKGYHTLMEFLKESYYWDRIEEQFD